MNTKDFGTSKQLQTRISKLSGEIKTIKEEISDKQRESANKHKKLNELKSHLKKLQSKKLSMSEHAIIRYVERGLNINIDSIKEKFLFNDEIKKLNKTLGNGSFPIKIDEQDYIVVIKNNTIVTVK